MVNNIQLTSQQKLQQEKINAYIDSLEDSLRVGKNNIKLDDNLHDTLAGVFKAFDTNSDSKFNEKETKVLVTHLKNLNSDNNIVSMFDKNGNLKLDSGGLDIDNDGNAGVQNDFVALSNMLSSKASVDYAESVMTGKGSKITLENGKQVSHGLGKHAVTFTTKGGYHIVTDTNNGGHQTKIFGADGKMLTHVSGDPHVNEGDSTKNRGWDWHFGDDSTFILDDGTEILFNTTGNAKTNVYVTRGLYIISDNDVYQTGLDLSDTGKRNKNISKLDISAVEFDALNADAKSEDNGADTFVYSKEANNGKGGWAVLTDDGTFEDVAYESWGTYRKGTRDGVSQTFDNQTVDTGNAVNASITLEQKEAALDGEAVRIYDRLEKAGATDEQKEVFFEYYFKEGANELMLNAFTTLVDKNGTDLQFDKLDAYTKNPTDIGVDLSSEQEANYLVNLITDEALAGMYLDLINKTNEVNTPDVFALNEAKLELFEDATLGGNALNASQATKMLEYADDDIAIAEAYVDLIKGGAEAEKVSIFESFLEKMDNTFLLDKFVDVLTDANKNETDLLKRLISDENGSIDLLKISLDIIDNPSSASIRNQLKSISNILVKYAFGQEDLFTDIIKYQNSQLDNDSEVDRSIMVQNTDLLSALDESLEGRKTYLDFTSNKSQVHLNKIFTKLDDGNKDMSLLGGILEVFNQSILNGNASADREFFYKDLFKGILNIDPKGMSDEDFRATVSESVFSSIQRARENGSIKFFNYNNFEKLVSPYAASAQTDDTSESEISEKSNSIIDSLKAHSDYKLVGMIASVFSDTKEDFTQKFNVITEKQTSIDTVAKETAELLVDIYESMIETEYGKAKPSMYMIRIWEKNVSQLKGIADS